MSIDNKRWLTTIVYYTLVVLALLSAGFFVYCLIMNTVAMWAKIIYFIWAGLVIGAVIFDIICTTTGEAKQVSGLIVYVLSLLAVIMACILYFVNSGTAGLSTLFLNLFVSVSIISLIATGFMIATWVVGENLVEHATSDKEMMRKKVD